MPLEAAFEYFSDYLDKKIKVVIDYNMESGPAYDSPLGPLGHETRIDHKITRISAPTGYKDFMKDYLENTQFSHEVDREIEHYKDRLAK